MALKKINNGNKKYINKINYKMKINKYLYLYIHGSEKLRWLRNTFTMHEIRTAGTE
jgi:hypothetical protein